MVSPAFGRVEEEEKNRSADMDIIPIGICAGPVDTVMDQRHQEADVIILHEGDYFGLNCTDAWAEDEAKKVLKRMTKDDLIAAARQCFRIYYSYIALRYRYDCLKNSMDILKDQNTGYLQTVKEIEELYLKAEQEEFRDWKPNTRKLENYLNSLPKEAWIQ